MKHICLEPLRYAAIATVCTGRTCTQGVVVSKTAARTCVSVGPDMPPVCGTEIAPHRRAPVVIYAADIAPLLICEMQGRENP